MRVDVVIVGGGPAGLAAALTLGRSRKRVVLLDSGPRRNAAAAHVHNFVTRDGTPPEEFRRVARAQLATYPNVSVRDQRVLALDGERGAFRVQLAEGELTARRVILCTGMIDEPPPIEGMRELWGHAVFQCPYCHGWEVQDRPWGYLVRAEDASMYVTFALQARAWTADVTVFTNGALEVSAEDAERLRTANVRVQTAPVRKLQHQDGTLRALELADGAVIPCEALFAHPPQRQVPLVQALDLTLDEHGFVQTDPMRRETSRPGLYAAGDLCSRMHAVAVASAAGMQAAAMLNMDLTLEQAARGEL